MNIPIFDASENAYLWILCLEKIFKEHQTPNSLKVLKAVGALRGSAFKWWIWWSRVHRRYNWDTFTIALLWRFKPEWRPILPLDDEEEEPHQEPPYESTGSFYSPNNSVEENEEDTVQESSFLKEKSYIVEENLEESLDPYVKQPKGSGMFIVDNRFSSEGSISFAHTMDKILEIKPPNRNNSRDESTTTKTTCGENLDQIFKLVCENPTSKNQTHEPLKPPSNIIKLDLLQQQKESQGCLFHHEISKDLQQIWEEKDGSFVHVLTNYQTNTLQEPLCGEDAIRSSTGVDTLIPNTQPYDPGPPKSLFIASTMVSASFLSDTRLGSLDLSKPTSNDVVSCVKANSTSSIQPSIPSCTISFTDATPGRHLARRLVQVGITNVFSVPGDFNLTLLNHLINEPWFNLIGCCNELNAGYAVDGYARSRGVGACVVTFTVSGLSVLNAIAGAYSENFPLICIVGGPNSNDYGSNRILRHTIELPDFSQELRWFQTVTCFHVVVNNLEDVHELIDTTISYGKAGKLSKSWEAYERMNNDSIVADTPIYSSLIFILGKAGSLKDACEVFEDMPKQGMGRDIVTFNTVISTACAHSKEEIALSLLKEIEEMSCKPNIQSFGFLACSQEEVNKVIYSAKSEQKSWAKIAGNSTVLKPPTQGAVAALHLVHCFLLAGFPKSLISCVTGNDSEFGKLHCVSFTGDPDIAISKKSGMMHLQMKLGGKDACIVLEDADLDLVGANIIKGGFSYSGQRCSAANIVLIIFLFIVWDPGKSNVVTTI